ncbi:MAG: hypothetical protein AB8W35_03635 [Coxiella endosymbiont of Dermacentor nuttalli]
MFKNFLSTKHSPFLKPDDIENSSIDRLRKNHKHDLTLREEFVDFFSSIYISKSKKALHELYERIHTENVFHPLNELDSFDQIKKLKFHSKQEYQNNYKAIFSYDDNYKYYVNIFYDNLFLKRKEIKTNYKFIEKFICDNFRYEYLFGKKPYIDIEKLTKFLIIEIKDIINYLQNVNFYDIYAKSSILNKIIEIRNNIPQIKDIITKSIDLDNFSSNSLKAEYKNIYNETLSKLQSILNQDLILLNKQDFHTLTDKIMDIYSNYIIDYSNELIFITKLADFSVIGDINSILNRLSDMKEITINKKDLQKEIDNAITIANKWVNLRNSSINSTR